MASKDLNYHADLLFRLSTCTHGRAWGDFANEMGNLATCLQSYASYLEKSNEQQKFRQTLSHPVRQIADHCMVQFFPRCQGPVKACYSLLDQIISESEVYLPVYFDETVHIQEPFLLRIHRHRFIEGLSLRNPVDVLTFDPGAGLGRTVFLWRVPDDRSPTEMMSAAAKVHKSIEKRLPEYHTREMRREFCRSYESLVDIPPHILRAIYADLTFDATASQNPAIDARLRQAILTGDPDIAIDLRTLNKGRPDDTFSVFFEQLDKEVATMTAVDERRHSDVQHFSKYLSVRDLIAQTAKNCPDGTPIPSESTVLFAFVPKNAYVNTAKLYKGRINLQHKVQSRQLRAAHVDEHYCAAIFSYLKRYAVKYRDTVMMLCLDDKSKVDYGEPGMAVSTGVRGKKSLVPVSSVLGALDHDIASKGSLTPSVCLHVDVPEAVTESFYRGQVHVTLKDSVFQPSSPFRHAVEMMKSVGDSPKPHLLLYSDGGPDHRTTYGSVKLSLIILFKVLHLDMLVAARTAPGHSWANPAERIMSLLNLAYQNVAIFRSEMSSNHEQAIRSCGTMKDIRKKAEKEEGLEDSWMKSVQETVQCLNNRTERVQLKGKNFQCDQPASKEEIHEFEQKVPQLVDPSITFGKYTKMDLRKCDEYQRYIESHCRERNYVFQVQNVFHPS